MYCPRGTKYAGRFDMLNLNNWQHTLSYPGVVMSGLVDLLEPAVPLPPGASQAVLGVGWGTMTWIMWLHEKHAPQVGWMGRGSLQAVLLPGQRAPRCMCLVPCRRPPARTHAN